MPDESSESGRLITRTELFGLLTAVVASIVASALATAVFLEWVQVHPYTGMVGVLTGVIVLILAESLMRIYLKEQETGGGLVVADPFGIGSKIAPNEGDRDD